MGWGLGKTPFLRNVLARGTDFSVDVPKSLPHAKLCRGLSLKSVAGKPYFVSDFLDVALINNVNVHLENGGNSVIFV